MVQWPPCSNSSPGALSFPAFLTGRVMSVPAGCVCRLGPGTELLRHRVVEGRMATLGWVVCRVAVVCADRSALQTGVPLVACGTLCSAGWCNVCLRSYRAPSASPRDLCAAAGCLSTSTTPQHWSHSHHASCVQVPCGTPPLFLHPHTFSPACELLVHACLTHNFLLCLFLWS